MLSRNVSRRSVVLGAGAGALAAQTGVARGAQFPRQALKIIVPFAAGGPADLYARVVAQHFQTDLRQACSVDNRPGAGALIGTGEAARTAADGCTLLMVSNAHTTNETLLTNKPYALMKDFTAVAPVNSSDLVLVVHPSVPAKTLAELIALAKDKPGALNYASSGPGTPYHMAAELFKTMSGTNFVHVPYKGSAGARNDIFGGHVQVMFDAVTTMAEAASSGQVRAIATTGKQRSTVLPDVPTVDEAGLKGYDASIWVGLMVPSGTPADVVDILNASVRKLQAQDATIKAWAKQGAQPLVLEPAAFDTYIHADIKKWADVIAKAGIKVQQ